MNSCNCQCHESYPDAYELLRDMPSLPRGVVFIHDKNDSEKGSPVLGCLKLAWVEGNCQADWCGHTYVLPGQLAEDRDWFRPVKNRGQYK